MNKTRFYIFITLMLNIVFAQMALPSFQAVHKPHSAASGTPENPLQSSGLSIGGTNIGWTYLMGYRFTPQTNGTVTQLGGYYNGTKTVYLWRWSDGLFLGSVSNSSSNNWTYTNLETAASLTSGTEYFVGVALNGGGAYIRAGGSALPGTYGNIRINSSAYNYGIFSSNTMPTSWSASTRTDYYWGLPDITFVPN